jgi:hypothetical protein
VWQGAWDGGASYAPGDVVTDGASSFVAVAPALPGDDPAFGPGVWELLAAGGLRGDQGPAGPTGPAGPQGLRGEIGATGPQGPSGPMGPVGPMGAQGSSALIRTDVELPGANCGTGGMKIEAGSDANRNGSLEAGEVNAALTRYVCNGAQGPQGIQGVQGAPGQQGVQGPQGPSGPPGPGTTAFGTSTNAANAGMPGGVDCVLGTVSLVAGNVGPGGMVADGRILLVQNHPALYAVLGNKFGGSAPTTFALPDLTSAAPNKMTYVVCTDGYFPMME